MNLNSYFLHCIPLSRRCSSLATHTLGLGDLLVKKRTYSEQDVLEYSNVSHDSNPVHLDSEAAKSAGFEGRLVHGMLVASLFPQIVSSHFPGAVYVSQSLNFRKPVYIGDGISGELRLIDIRLNKNRYLAKFSTKCLKGDGSVAVEGEAMAILPTPTVNTSGSELVETGLEKHDSVK